MSWLDNVQVGDQVVKRRDWPTEIAELHTISKVNKTQIVLDDGDRFDRNGRLWGGDHWHLTYLVRRTPNSLREIDEVNQRRRANRLRRTIIERLEAKGPETDLDALEQIAAVLGIS